MDDIQTEKYIKEHVKEIPKIAIILGSGLGSLADDIEDLRNMIDNG